MSAKGYNRQKARRHRRRWQYPELKAGEVATIEREECGMALPFLGKGRVLNGKFELVRAIPRTSRSKYMPKARAA